MPLPVGAVLGAAGISAGGSILGGGLGSMVSANQAGIDRDDRRYYAENAHQVEVKDLRAAGLNPIMSATGGSGAHFQGASGNNSGDSLAAGISSSAQAMMQIPQLLADLDVKAATADNIVRDTALKEKQGMIADADVSLRAGALDKLNIDKKYWDGSALAEYQKLLRDVDLKHASAGAASSSARHYDALVRQIGQSMTFERQGGGYKTGLAHDLKSFGTKVEEAISEWLKNPGRAPIGDTNAKRSR